MHNVDFLMLEVVFFMDRTMLGMEGYWLRK